MTSREQLAAAMSAAWPVTPAYRITQPGRRVQALQTWRRSVRIYLATRSAPGGRVDEHPTGVRRCGSRAAQDIGSSRNGETGT